jgi:hypothetical protein
MFVLYDVHPLSIYNSGIYCALTQFVIMALPPMIIASTVKIENFIYVFPRPLIILLLLLSEKET